jgi:hypothetical protein
VQRVCAGADICDRELAVFATLGPELIVFRVVIPGDEGAVARALGKGRAGAVEFRVGQADVQMGQFRRSGLRIVEHELASDCAPPVLLREIHALHPGIGPLGVDGLGLVQGILKQSVCVGRPGGRDRGIALSGLERVEIGLGWRLGALKGIEINKDRTHDLVPLLAGRRRCTRRPGVVVSAKSSSRG